MGLALDRYEQLHLVVAANLEHDSASAGANVVGGTANVFATRVGLRWMPGNMFIFGLDYSFRDQRASAPTSTTPSTIPSTFASFHRQLVVFTVEAQYPTRF
jgi:hypothetical protein